MNSFLKTLIVFIILLGVARCRNEGCMDIDAVNYNPNANKNDGLCSYRYLSAVIVNKIPLIEPGTRTPFEWDADYEGTNPDLKFYIKMQQNQMWEIETNVAIDNSSYPFMWKIDILKNHYLHWNQTYNFILADEDFVGMDTILAGSFIHATQRHTAERRKARGAQARAAQEGAAIEAS
jgi:hypothetical protein